MTAFTSIFHEDNLFNVYELFHTFFMKSYHTLGIYSSCLNVLKLDIKSLFIYCYLEILLYFPLSIYQNVMRLLILLNIYHMSLILFIFLRNLLWIWFLQKYELGLFREHGSLYGMINFIRCVNVNFLCILIARNGDLSNSRIHVNFRLNPVYFIHNLRDIRSLVYVLWLLLEEYLRFILRRLDNCL
jgi:hypothetical protein